MTSDGMSPADYAAITGNRGNGGFGYDGGLEWIIILFLFGLFGGWGGNRGGFGGGSDFGLYPWLNNSDQISGGFRDQMLNTSVQNIQNSLTSGFGDLQTALCGGFAGVNAAITNAQMADMQQAFAAQTAMNQGFNGVQSQLAQCCCDNRLATCQTQNIVQNEGAATRLAIQQQTQAILDKMCQQEIDALKAQNIALQNQVNMQNLSASQVQQTAQLIADNTAQTQYIVNRVAPYPIPSYTVPNPYGTATTTAG